MSDRYRKILDFTVILLLAAHAAIAAYSYYVPGAVSGAVVVLSIIFLLAVKKFSLRRVSRELLFVLCAVNLPFGAGGYLYRPWTMAAAAAVCLLPPIVRSLRGAPLWPAFRWSFIALVTAGFFISAAMRADGGFSRCGGPARRQAAGKLLASFENPYGVYAGPGGCPVFACYSMSHAVGVRTCGGDTSYHETGGNPQRAALDTARNRVYFPVRGTAGMVVAAIEPFEILDRVEVPGAQSLLNADVHIETGRIALVDERVHSLFVLDPDSFDVELEAGLGWGESYSVSVDQARGYAFVSDWAGAFLHRVNLDTGETDGRYIGLAAFNNKVEPETGLVYVTRPLRGAVAVFDAETLDFVMFLPAGYGVRDVVIDRKRNRIVCGNYFDGTVDVADLETGEITARHEVGSLVRGVAVDDTTGDIFVAWTCGVSRLPFSGDGHGR